MSWRRKKDLHSLFGNLNENPHIGHSEFRKTLKDKTFKKIHLLLSFIIRGLQVTFLKCSQIKLNSVLTFTIV